MTTKSKPRKAPAAKVTPEKAVSGTKHEVSEICRLVSRWKWLMADQQYQAAVAETIGENERLIAVHEGELKKIEHKLVDLVPENIWDACMFLKFATEMVDRGLNRGDGAIVSMLTNIHEGLRTALCDQMGATREELKAERAKGFAEGNALIREIFEINDRAIERAKASP
jgi:hypothetical protein